MEHDCIENDSCGGHSTTIYKDAENEWIMNAHCGDAVIVINYCPFCGEHLK
ncbi:hypothetical protein [Paenibacillus sp. FSL L8-0494]|uniref:hypothetical protein n=1 Tax=Paenibacillus sp. FSL L8-0494 TaxID=2975352 RepID=UPI0030FCE047